MNMTNWPSLNFFFSTLSRITLSRTSLVLLLVSLSCYTYAGPREQAKRIHDRLVGVPPTAAVLDAMAVKVSNDDALGAAYDAMENKLFYTVALKNYVMPWTNEAQTVFAELNDYAATVIGIIRDDLPFTQVLTGDIVYIGSPDQVSTLYSHTDNTHYRELEDQQIDLSDPTIFFSVPQSSLADTQLTADDVSGVLTTRSFAQAFLSGGTNRLAWRVIGLNHLCHDMEEMSDITLTPDRIRQDVSRSPGGDSSIFLNSCVGCHAGLDSLSQAFAYLNFDEELSRLVHTPGQVQEKYLINSNAFRFGFVTQDNRWDNYWRHGKNALLGWRGEATGGFGVKSMAEEVVNSRAFSQCHVKQAFERVCFRSAKSLADKTEVARITDVFEVNNYSMKRVFAEVATYCMGE